MIDPAAFLSSLISALKLAHVPHMLAGSFASSMHGVPRATGDIDLIIDPTTRTLDNLLALLAREGFYLDPDTARSEFRRRGQFNVIDATSAWKADLIYRKGRAFSRAEFQRRAPETLLGVTLFIASAEDTILAKLEWAKSGGGEQQLRDVQGIIEAQGETLDRTYISSWLDDLGVRALWEQVLRGEP